MYLQIINPPLHVVGCRALVEQTQKIALLPKTSKKEEQKRRTKSVDYHHLYTYRLSASLIYTRIDHQPILSIHVPIISLSHLCTYRSLTSLVYIISLPHLYIYQSSVSLIYTPTGIILSNLHSYRSYDHHHQYTYRSSASPCRRTLNAG